MTDTFDVTTFDVREYDRILACGLSRGPGTRGSQVCIEAAICQVLGREHGDDPGCVAESVRTFKIRLNDSKWSSPEARANGLHDLGLAQLGSKGVVSNMDFSRLITEKTIRVLIPDLFRKVFKGKADCLAAADRCEKEGTADAARSARDVARKYYIVYYAAVTAAVDAAYYGAYYAAAVDAAYYGAVTAAVRAAVHAAVTAVIDDYYLNLSAHLALEVLRELNSPGVALLERAV